MLTPHDEFPVHQAPHPFSYVPSTDYSWDDGYYFGVFSPRDKVFLAIGLRVNPNTDMVGGRALFNWAGRQYTVRFNRCWRRDFALRVGPFSIEFVEPLRKIRLVLAKDASELEFDLLWEGTTPAYEEEHHVSVHRGRRSTDQTRYSQPGKAGGFYHLHETADGLQVKMNDVFGIPFAGKRFRGRSESAITMTAGRHELEFESGTRILKSGRIVLTDQDGGTFFTYHGSEELAFEWDDFDFSKQPMRYSPYQVSGAAAHDEFGLGLNYEKPIHGIEYLAEITTIAPDGSTGSGASQVEFFINGPYRPYGFE